MIKGLEIALDIFCSLLLLLFGWILTSVASMHNRFVNISSGYDHPVPSEEAAWVMIVFVWILPIAYLAIMHLIMTRNWRNTLLLLLSWVNTLALVIFFTSLIRHFLPSPRPYFASRCMSSRVSGYMMDASFCTNHISRHDMQSFPSGHTSLIWASWLFVLLTLSLISGTFTRTGGFWKMLLFFVVPLVVPVWMAFDRVRVGEHFFSDIIIGTLLGILIALVSFFNMDWNRLT